MEVDNYLIQGNKGDSKSTVDFIGMDKPGRGQTVDKKGRKKKTEKAAGREKGKEFSIGQCAFKY